MNLADLKSNLDSDLDRAALIPKALLSNLSVLDEASRLTSSYSDPRCLPFYYHLAKYIAPQSVLVVGLNLGLAPCCFIKNQQSVKHLMGLQKKKEYYSVNLAYKNIRKSGYRQKFYFYQGDLGSDLPSQISFTNWDLVILDAVMSYDEYRFCLDCLWDYMNLDGLLIVEKHIQPRIKQAFSDFCKIKNKEPLIIDSRYEIGIVKK